jgi:hypothetical protein
MNGALKRRLEKIEQATRPRYPETRKLTPEERVYYKEIARRLVQRMLAQESETGEYKEHTPEERRAVINEIVEGMKAEGYRDPSSEGGTA